MEIEPVTKTLACIKEYTSDSTDSSGELTQNDTTKSSGKSNQNDITTQSITENRESQNVIITKTSTENKIIATTETQEEMFQRYVKNYYEGNIEESRMFLEIVATNKQFSHIYKSVFWNAQYYISKCPSDLVRIMKPQFFTSENEAQTMFGINPFLVSDLKTGDLIVGIRCLNYAGNDGFEPMCSQGQIETKYEIHILSHNARNIKQTFPLNIICETKFVERAWPYATGIEDLRVINHFEDKDLFVGCCTGIETHEAGPVRMCYFTLQATRNSSNTITKLTMTNLFPLTGYQDDLQQKNWIPFFHNSQLYLMYSATPTIVLKPQLNNVVEKTQFDSFNLHNQNNEITSNNVTQGKTIHCDKISEEECTLWGHKNGTPFVVVPLVTEIRQSGENQVICCKNLRITLAHISIDHTRRIYYHRFLIYDTDDNCVDGNLKLVKYSKIFYFEHASTIEFASGLHFDNVEKCFYIGFGYRDRFAHIHKLSLINFESLFIH